MDTQGIALPKDRIKLLFCPGFGTFVFGLQGCHGGHEFKLTVIMTGSQSKRLKAASVTRGRPTRRQPIIQIWCPRDMLWLLKASLKFLRRENPRAKSMQVGDT